MDYSLRFGFVGCEIWVFQNLLGCCLPCFPKRFFTIAIAKTTPFMIMDSAPHVSVGLEGLVGGGHGGGVSALVGLIVTRT